MARILVWMPSFNEEENVAFMVEALNAANHPFVVCDGYSTDKTEEIAMSLGAETYRRSGIGKGYAVRDGLRYADEHGYDGLVLIDCDRTYLVSDIDRLITEFDGNDMVVGCRPYSKMSLLRRWANMLMTTILRILYRYPVRDMASGLRLLRVSKYQDGLSAVGFDIEPEMYAYALRQQYRISQVDIDYLPRHGNSKVDIRHLFLLIYRMVIDRFR